MKILKIILLLSTVTLMSCGIGSFRVQKVPTTRVNPPPAVVTPFEAVDVDNDGNITRDEYREVASTLDTKTPSYALLIIVISVSVIVGSLVYLTKCWKRPGPKDPEKR